MRHLIIWTFSIALALIFLAGCRSAPTAQIELEIFNGELVEKRYREEGGVTMVDSTISSASLYMHTDFEFEEVLFSSVGKLDSVLNNVGFQSTFELRSDKRYQESTDKRSIDIKVDGNEVELLFQFIKTTAGLSHEVIFKGEH